MFRSFCNRLANRTLKVIVTFVLLVAALAYLPANVSYATHPEPEPCPEGTYRVDHYGHCVPVTPMPQDPQPYVEFTDQPAVLSPSCVSTGLEACPADDPVVIPSSPDAGAYRVFARTGRYFVLVKKCWLQGCVVWGYNLSGSADVRWDRSGLNHIVRYEDQATLFEGARGNYYCNFSLGARSELYRNGSLNGADKVANIYISRPGSYHYNFQTDLIYGGITDMYYNVSRPRIQVFSTANPGFQGGCTGGGAIIWNFFLP